MGDDYRVPVQEVAYGFFYNQFINSYQAYSATHLSWHTVSEHQLSGMNYDAELQIYL